MGNDSPSDAAEQWLIKKTVAVWKIGMWQLPVAGGGYFGLFPAVVLENVFRRMIAGGTTDKDLLPSVRVQRR